MKTLIALLYLSFTLTSYVPVPESTAVPANTGWYALPAAFKLMPRQVVPLKRNNYVLRSEECGLFTVTNASATAPARIILTLCDGTHEEIFIEPGATVSTSCLDTFNIYPFNVVEGAILLPNFIVLCN